MGGAAALELEDMAFTQYREPGILMWRDFGMQAGVLCSFAGECVKRRRKVKVLVHRERRGGGGKKEK